MKQALFDFLRSIGLQPIEWAQAVQLTGQGSPYIGNILDAAFDAAQAVVILLTGDDEARLIPNLSLPDDPDYESVLTRQPRLNVIFEAGRAFGTHPDRTILVQIGDVRPFSDIAGRHLVRLDNSISRRQELTQRLMTAGCSLDLSGTDWHTVGEFTSRRAGATRGARRATADIITNSLPSDAVTTLSPGHIVLKAVALLGNEMYTAKQIATVARMPVAKAEHYLAEYGKRDYVNRTQKSGDAGPWTWWYWMTEKGSRYLVRNNII